MGRELAELEFQSVTDSYFLFEERFCRRLNGVYKEIAGLIFIPVEIVQTGHRDYVRSDLLRPLTDMEVLAWSAK